MNIILMYKDKTVRVVITLLILCTLLSIFFVIRGKIISKDCDVLDSAFIAMLSGDKELSSFDIKDSIKDEFLKYQKENSNEDTYKVVICDNVNSFNSYLNSVIETEDTSISSDYSSNLDLTSLDYENPVVHYDGNEYFVYLKDIFYNSDNKMTVNHKGYKYTILKDSTLKPCYFRRGVSPAQIVDTKDTLFKHKMLCYDVTSNSMTLILKKGLFSVYDVEIAERGEFFSE